MVVPSPITFQGGQMTDLPSFEDAQFDGTELFEVVAPGNVEDGVNYSITSLVLAQLLSLLTVSNTIITTGATTGDPYEVPSDETRILINKTVASDTAVDIGGGADRLLPVMVRDLAGNADTYNISVSFTGTCDGLSSPIVISNPYGGWVFNPLEDGNWFLTNT